MITAIKSGDLKKEQEESNKRIQDILLSILDEDTLKMFDDLFKEENPAKETIAEEDEEDEELSEFKEGVRGK